MGDFYCGNGRGGDERGGNGLERSRSVREGLTSSQKRLLILKAFPRQTPLHHLKHLLAKRLFIISRHSSE